METIPSMLRSTFCTNSESIEDKHHRFRSFQILINKYQAMKSPFQFQYAMILYKTDYYLSIVQY